MNESTHASEKHATKKREIQLAAGAQHVKFTAFFAQAA